MTALDRLPNLDELIARLERATGPDRELDRDIGIAVLGWKPVQREYKGELYAFLDVGDGEVIADSPGAAYPSPTESIDDALKLVPQSGTTIVWRIGVVADSKTGTKLATASIGTLLTTAEAVTPALALCLAALRARKAMAVTPSVRLDLPADVRSRSDD